MDDDVWVIFDERAGVIASGTEAEMRAMWATPFDDWGTPVAGDARLAQVHDVRR